MLITISHSSSLHPFAAFLKLWFPLSAPLGHLDVQSLLYPKGCAPQFSIQHLQHPEKRLRGRWPKVKQASLAQFFLLIHYSTPFLSETPTNQTNNTTGHNLTAWSYTRMRFHTPSRAGTSISEAGRLQESINSRNTSSFWLEKIKPALRLPKSAYAAFF